MIVKPKNERKRINEKISLKEARKIIMEDPNRLLRSSKIQEEAFYRLRNYPKQISDNLHSTMVTIPRKIAHLLHQKPAYVSAAVEAFYLRDPIALRPLRSKEPNNLVFKPEDFVTVSVRFTRVGYAQLKSQEFPVPKSWVGKLPSRDDRKAYDRAEVGMKLTCGFEMLLSDPQNQDKPTVREIKLVLEDVETGDEKLPTNEEIDKSWDKREDDEKWLDINMEDLDTELKGRKGKDKDEEHGAEGAFGDANAQENLQRIVARFEEFMNDNSAGFEGADFIDDFASDSDIDEDDDDEVSSEGEDNEVPFNEEELSRMMKEMGMPSKSGAQGASSRGSNRIEELNDDSDYDDTEQIQELSKQMEAELRGTGALDLNRRPEEQSSDNTASIKGQKGASSDDKPEEDRVLEESDDPNINLVKNMLESIQGQGGGTGPAGNMLSMMDLPIPKADKE